ncbi:endonuclease VIII [Shimwellia blattae]|uniref:DNA-(apurinic or apyrimidinic site) lyase n=1 Tax=Shimwellia blattae (strain ATCC 29907 / DSM 4481 / JCM 1650 / NBRC 105725 / CDC 9005-74) TaxID=630626 RepID=I2BB49_SHIBC|nr:endonuclease VIII [Shimwellia blattae]AFJ47753.1 endonuclease VIII [Shimwellia blattae DSM 4481 = NBRC 105725]GAB79670.1 endonuclease VIII [Shimwellia blattae DSM 4481 = NBRC 105725]
MPEGPEIRRAADMLAAAVQHQPLTRVWFAFPELERYAPQLVGQTIVRFETHGKALLTHFSGGLILYSHNQLYGVWRVSTPGSEADSARSLRVRLETATSAILLYSASDIEMLNSDTVTRHPFLSKAGPDVLNSTLTVQAVRERLMSPRFCRRQLGSLLLDQKFLAGLGNYLRAEILWQAQVSGLDAVRDLDDAQVTALADACLSVARLSYQTRGQVDENYHHGALFRFRVFQREGEPCERCGTGIIKTVLSGRPFWFCPHCQPVVRKS